MKPGTRERASYLMHHDPTETSLIPARISTSTRRRWLLANLLGLALSFHALPAAQAEGDGPEAEGIQWHTSWQEGRTAAAKDGKLIFVYFGRHAPR